MLFRKFMKYVVNSLYGSLINLSGNLMKIICVMYKRILNNMMICNINEVETII